MPEIIPEHVPSPRTPLFWDGTAYRPVSIDAAGRIQVRGEDQVFSYDQNLHFGVTDVISGADGYIDIPGPGAASIWHVTNIVMFDVTSPTTSHAIYLRVDPTNYELYRDTTARVAVEWNTIRGDWWLDTADVLRLYFIGGLAGDSCRGVVLGNIMTREV